MQLFPVRRCGAGLLVAACLALASCRGAAPPPAAAPPPPPVTQLGEFRAVLLNGGGKKELNFQSHLTHVRTVVDFLRGAGVADDDIAIFSGDGEDPAADLATRDLHDGESDWLLPQQLARRLRPPIDYVDSQVDGFPLRPATSAALTSWFLADGQALGPGDTLLFYVTDHGERNDDDLANNTIVLWNERLTVAELRTMLGLLRPGVRVVMLMAQCFSGSFAHTPFAPGAGLTTDGLTCGYYASSADRPAYGCYPENRGVEGVGYSHHFLVALAALGRMPEAERRVLITDDSPDVPNTTSDFYLQQLLAAEAAAAQKKPVEIADAYIDLAFKHRADWESEIRLMDRIGTTFGMFSPRSLSELELQTMMLPQVSAQLRTYADRWGEALNALKLQNLDRFLTAHPDWRARLDGKQLVGLDATARRQFAVDLMRGLEPFTAADPATLDRLALLRARQDAAAAAAYRMEVRLGVVLRMRALLDQIAGRVYLTQRGTPEQRQTYAALRACEDVNFLAEPPFASAAAMPPPEQFPGLDDDRQVVHDVMPAWMGIQFRPTLGTPQARPDQPRGAATVMMVYPDSAAGKAGLEVGDIILGPPGAPFTEPHQVREWTMRREIGEPAPLEILRGSARQVVTLHPEPYPIKIPEMPGPPKVGSVAPQLKLEPFRGGTDFAAATPRLLFFWATWCLPCKFSLPEVMALAKARNVEVVAITDEDPETLQKFFATFKEPFPATVAIDPYRQAFQAYGVSGTPTFVLLGADGTVQYYRSGYNAQKGLEIEGWKYK